MTDSKGMTIEIGMNVKNGDGIVEILEDYQNGYPLVRSRYGHLFVADPMACTAIDLSNQHGVKKNG